MIKTSISLIILFLLVSSILFAQDESKDKAKELLNEAKVESLKKEIELTVRNVDISKFPEIKITIEAYNKLGQPLDTLTADNLYVYENGVQKKVISVEKIPIVEKSAVDFIFLIDKTGSMQQKIDAVRSNVRGFSNSLMRRGIDYRLGLVLFNDDIESIEQPTDNVTTFLGWLKDVKAKGGGDEKENALEALEVSAMDIEYRMEADRVAVLITDAPYHQKGEEGFGVTNRTTESIIELLQENQVRVFSIVPPKLKNYHKISADSRGNYYDIDYPFSTILDNFSNQLTNLYKLTYNSGQEAIPDSIEISLFSRDRKTLVKKTIPIVELGRKLIIENLLFQTAKYDLPDSVRELDLLADFMIARPNVAIIVEGHTDAVGSFATNDLLSKNRANSVKDYLVKRGVSEFRIQTQGYGERKPIATNETEFGRKLNRRTEIIIVAK